jgi:hypothetical protein
MTDLNLSEVDGALTDLEGILHALDILRFQNELNKPGPAYHALAVLTQLAVEKVGEVRHTIWPGDAAEPDSSCSCSREAAL